MDSREDQVTQTLVRLADTLVTGYDSAEMFYFLVESCQSVLAVDQAGLMLADVSGNLHVVAATSEVTHIIELLQIQNQEGPCLDAVRTGIPVDSGSLASPQAKERWPVLADAAVRGGFDAIHALPMKLRGHVLGGLNLFFVKSRQPLPERDIAVAQAFANIGTIAILHDRAARDARGVIDQLQLALDTRVVIEQSKGLVAQHSKLTMDESFASIRAYARNHNLRLGDVARDLIAGNLDPTQLGLS